MQRGFGRIKSPYDSRDYNLEWFIPKKGMGKAVTERVWDFPLESLDQEETPHCVGFSMASFGINLPVLTPYTNAAGHKFYYKCKVVDGDPQSEEGSTIRSAAKVLKQEGVIGAYAFAPSVEAIRYWVLNKGPMIIGTIWTEGMMCPDDSGIIEPTGNIVGGHATLINEWRKDDYIRIQNSWGPDWGIDGSAYIHVEDFKKIFNYDGEAMTAVELEQHKKPCAFCDFIKNIFS